MGVATSSQGTGLGVALTRFVCEFALRSEVVVGTRGVVVDAKADALGFYARFGFVAYDVFPTATGTTRLMLPNEKMRRVLSR